MKSKIAGKTKIVFNHLWRSLLRMGRVFLRQTALNNFIERHEALLALTMGITVATIVMTPILSVWLLLWCFLSIPIDWLRALAIWSLILVLFILGGLTDEVRKERGF